MGPETELAPIVAIGGLLTIKQVAEWYKPLLSQDTDSTLPSNKRFLAPPKRGLGKIEDMHEELNERLTTMQERLGGRKLMLVGHSLGGLMATMTAVERPDLVAGVVSLGGAHEGYRKDTVATHVLKRVVGRHPQAGHLRHDSDFMLEHNDKMAQKWPDNVPLHIISTPLDTLIVPPHGFGVKAGTNEVHKRLVIPPGWGLETLARKVFQIEDDVEMLRSRKFTEHTNLPRNKDIGRYVNQARYAMAGYVEQESSNCDQRANPVTELAIAA